MLGIYYNILTKTNTFFYKIFIRLRHRNVKLGRNLKIYGKLLFSISKDSVFNIGNNVILRSATKYNFVGINKPVSIFVNKNAKLVIGNNNGFSGTSIFVTKKIVIGDYCNFGGNTAIWDTDFHPLEYQYRRIHEVSKIKSASIFIGDDVFVGANSIILKGVTIGNRVIIGAGSVVTKNIPEDEIWAGNPAKFIRKIVHQIN